MELIAGYLCDKLKGLIEGWANRLGPKLKRSWKKYLILFLYELAMNVLANIIANLLLK